MNGRKHPVKTCPVLIGRGGEIRTPDPLLPKQLRYQAALHPDTVYSRALSLNSGGYVNVCLIFFAVDYHKSQTDNALLLKRP